MNAIGACLPFAFLRLGLALATSIFYEYLTTSSTTHDETPKSEKFNQFLTKRRNAGNISPSLDNVLRALAGLAADANCTY